MPETTWHFGTRPISDLDAALAFYSRKEFRSPFRSTVALFSLIKHGGHIWDSIANELTGGSSKIDAHLEFQVKSPRGIGKASHTDLMLLTARQAIAIESKWTEPAYESVAHWLSSENRREVLQGWLSLIERHIPKSLCPDDVASAVYQTVHRAASACHSNRAPTLAYLQFTGVPAERPTSLIQNLQQLHAVFGTPTGFRFVLIDVVLQPTPAFDSIKHLIKGLDQTAGAVIEALRNGPLFRFAIFRILEIGAKSAKAGR